MNQRIAVIALMLVLLPIQVSAGESDNGAKPDSTRVHRADTTNARAKALEDGWPDTPAGMIGSAWVEAFAEGEEAMQRFLENSLPEKSLAERSLKERLAGYKAIYNQYGSLMLASVEESAPEELKVVLLAEDASRHRFVFTVETEPPHKLVKIMMYQKGHSHGHGSH